MQTTKSSINNDDDNMNSNNNNMKTARNKMKMMICENHKQLNEKLVALELHKPLAAIFDAAAYIWCAISVTRKNRQMSVKVAQKLFH